ncbi:MAG: Lrp/AsnC ligand binding domain-containing protein [Armatimonadota bacterium]|nr:Lrp/AsnC ligand binding domain-containing protein [Armatimonadota bacterium]MDR7435338.1 Lrp/AsnC ligand binding domain-containing protein [Armatimonadota bacterium]
MAIQAYILIRVVPGKVSETLKALQENPEVKMAHAVTGPTDVIAFVEAQDMDHLGRFVVGKVQQAPGVTRTTTCVVTHV